MSTARNYARTAKGVSDNLNSELSALKVRTMRGLLTSGFLVQGRSQKKVPIEYGNLRASAYTQKAQHDALAVHIGFSAAYGLYVHENLEQRLKGKPRPSGLGVYWGPEGEPKFLTGALMQSVKEILEIVRKDAEIKA